MKKILLLGTLFFFTQNSLSMLQETPATEIGKTGSKENLLALAEQQQNAQKCSQKASRCCFAFLECCFNHLANLEPLTAYTPRRGRYAHQPE